MEDAFIRSQLGVGSQFLKPICSGDHRHSIGCCILVCSKGFLGVLQDPQPDVSVSFDSFCFSRQNKCCTKMPCRPSCLWFNRKHEGIGVVELQESRHVEK